MEHSKTEFIIISILFIFLALYVIFADEAKAEEMTIENIISETSINMEETVEIKESNQIAERAYSMVGAPYV